MHRRKAERDLGSRFPVVRELRISGLPEHPHEVGFVGLAREGKLRKGFRPTVRATQYVCCPSTAVGKYIFPPMA